MTERLYYRDSHMRSFQSEVLSCIEEKGKFAVQLAATAFFPEGGGQLADTGTLGGVNVLDVQEKGGDIVHYTDAPLSPGETVTGEICWPVRFRRMQNHSGEHVVSGIVHRLYGYNNVGFHMGSDDITIDFDGYLSKEELEKVERLANEAVADNLSITAAFPTPEELQTLDYRSKLELTENVRIVTIDGVDVCACCAPHVSETCEIGMIKLFDSIRHKGGVRVRMLCGLDAFDDYKIKYDNVAAISAMLSAKQNETAAAVSRVMAELEAQKRLVVDLKNELVSSVVSGLRETEGNLCVLVKDFDANQLRRIVNAGTALCGGICGAFSGNDETGYNYIIGSKTIDLRARAKEINTALSGRGGGTPEMIQGHVNAAAAEIQRYFEL